MPSKPVANSLFNQLKDDKPTKASPTRSGSPDKHSVNTRSGKTFAAEMRDMRMKAAKDVQKMSPAMSKFGKNLDNSARTSGVRNPKEVAEWNPLDFAPPPQKPTASFRSPERCGLNEINPRQMLEETPPPGYYDPGNNPKKPHTAQPKAGRKGEESAKVYTGFARTQLPEALHLYHQQLRGWRPQLSGRSSGDSKSPSFKSQMKGYQSFTKSRRDNHPNSRMAHTVDMSHGVVCGSTPPSGTQRINYHVPSNELHKTIFRASSFGTSIADQMGRSKPIASMRERDWERGVDGVCAADLPKKATRGSPSLRRTTGRDSNLKLRSNMPREKVPDAVYETTTAWDKNTARACVASLSWDHPQSRDDFRATHRTAVSQLAQSSPALTVGVPGGMHTEKDLHDSREYLHDGAHSQVHSQLGNTCDFSTQGSREMLFNGSNNDANNVSQVPPGTGLRSHFSSQHKQSDRNEWGRTDTPPYKVLDSPRSKSAGDYLQATGTLSTPIRQMGRSSEDLNGRSLVCGAPGFDFSTHTNRDTPPVIGMKCTPSLNLITPSPMAYKPNHGATKSSVSAHCLVSLEKTKRHIDATAWIPPAEGGHLNPLSPRSTKRLVGHVKKKSEFTVIRNGFRDTTIKNRGEGCDTAYSPRGESFTRVTGQSSSKISTCDRSHKSGSRFENEFASVGDFQPPHQAN